MKKKPAIFVVLFAVCALWLVVAEKRQEERSRQRGETHMLDILAAGIEEFLRTRERMPTNWIEIAGTANWSVITGISERYKLPDPVESYMLLREEVVVPSNPDSFIVLIRSNSMKHGHMGFGRWAIRTIDKKVSRVWLKEGSISNSILSQIKRPN